MHWWAVAAALPWLAACGGGGDDGAGAQPDTAMATGLWQGTTSDGHAVRMLVLEDGQAWGFFAKDAMLDGALALRVQGSGDRLSFSAGGVGIGYTIPSGGFSGSVQAGQSLRLAFDDGTRLDLAHATSHGGPPAVAALAGRYGIVAHAASHVLAGASVHIDEQGNFSHTSAGCTMTGRLRPAAGGQGYFDTHVGFSGPCSAFADGTALDGVTLAEGSAGTRTLATLVTGHGGSWVLMLQALASATP